MSDESNPPNEWYVPPPSWFTAVVSALFGVWGGAITAVAIDAHRLPMVVVLGLASVALVVVVVRRPGGGTVIGSASHGVAESLGKRFAARRSASASASGAPADSPAAPGPSIAEEIAKLGELRDAGVITEAEFTAQKAKLLDR